MYGCSYSPRSCDHFTEHIFNLLTNSIFVKVSEEQTLIGKDRFELVFECLRFSYYDILKLFLKFLVHRIWCKFKFISFIIHTKHISKPSCDSQRNRCQSGGVSEFRYIRFNGLTESDTNHLRYIYGQTKVCVSQILIRKTLIKKFIHKCLRRKDSRVCDYRKTLIISNHTRHLHHIFVCVQHMRKQIISQNHTQRTCCRMYRIQAYCYFHTLRKVHRISVSHIYTETFFQSRPAVREAVFNYEILRFLCINKWCNICFLTCDNRLHILNAKILKVYCNLLAWTRCDLIDHRPWERNRFLITYIIYESFIYEAGFLPLFCHRQYRFTKFRTIL